jgi:hypothetical protein
LRLTTAAAEAGHSLAGSTRDRQSNDHDVEMGRSPGVGSTGRTNREDEALILGADSRSSADRFLKEAELRQLDGGGKGESRANAIDVEAAGIEPDPVPKRNPVMGHELRC